MSKIPNGDNDAEAWTKKLADRLASERRDLFFRDNPGSKERYEEEQADAAQRHKRAIAAARERAIQAQEAEPQAPDLPDVPERPKHVPETPPAQRESAVFRLGQEVNVPSSSGIEGGWKVRQFLSEPNEQGKRRVELYKVDGQGILQIRELSNWELAPLQPPKTKPEADGPPLGPVNKEYSIDKVRHPDIAAGNQTDGESGEVGIDPLGVSGAPGITRIDPLGVSGAPGITRIDPLGVSGAPGITRIEGTETGSSATSSFLINLPPEVARDFDIVRELEAAAGQATLLLCRRKGGLDEDLVVVKIFRPYIRTQHDQDVLWGRLQGLASPHIVKLERTGTSFGHSWEVMEYYPLGSLADWQQRSKGPASDGFTRTILCQVASVFQEIHSASPRIVHRDVKPGNILLLSLDPLQCALTDFGLASVLNLSMEQRSAARTFAYAAPEAGGGEVRPALDWWGLGMTLAELILGYHPLAGYEGAPMPSDGEIIAAINSRPIPLDEVQDKRWKQLLRGLLTRNPRLRWGSDEVKDWLAGGFPEVAVDNEALPPLAFPFVGLQVMSLSRMGAALAANWDASRRLIMGPAFNDLLLWADRLDSTGSVAAAHEAFTKKRLSPDATVAALIAAMAPRLAPSFRGETLSRPALAVLAAEAVQELEGNEKPGPRAALVDQLFESGAMTAYGPTPGHPDDLPTLDREWRDMMAEVDRVAVKYLPAVSATKVTGAHARSTLLQCITNDNALTDVTIPGARAIKNNLAREQPWFDTLCRLAVSEQSIPMFYVVERTVDDAERRAADVQRLAAEVLDASNGLGAHYRTALDAERKAISEIGGHPAAGDRTHLMPVPAEKSRLEQIRMLHEAIPLAVPRLKDLATSCRIAAENHRKLGDQATAKVPMRLPAPVEPFFEPTVVPDSLEASSYRAISRQALIAVVVGVLSWTLLLWPNDNPGALGPLWIILFILGGLVCPFVVWAWFGAREGGKASVEHERSSLAAYQQQKENYQKQRLAYLRKREEWELKESERDVLLRGAQETQRRERQYCENLQNLERQMLRIAGQLSDDKMLAKMRDAIRLSAR